MGFDMNLDAYQELGVEPGVSLETIRRAYREQVRRYHPDQVPEEQRAEYEEKMKRINRAYEILSDPYRRVEYDAYRKARAQSTLPPSSETAGRSYAAFHDPYARFRHRYWHQKVQVELASEELPRWAQVLSGLFAGVGLVVGFVLGLPFGGVGCLPGAVIGFLVGALVGAFLFYLLALLIPAALIGWLGTQLAGEAGLIGGLLLGACLGFLWLKARGK